MGSNSCLICIPCIPTISDDILRRLSSASGGSDQGTSVSEDCHPHCSLSLHMFMEQCHLDNGKSGFRNHGLLQILGKCLLPHDDHPSSHLPLPGEHFSVAEVVGTLFSFFSNSFRKHVSQLSCVNLRLCEMAYLPKDAALSPPFHVRKRELLSPIAHHCSKCTIDRVAEQKKKEQLRPIMLGFLAHCLLQEHRLLNCIISSILH